MPPMKTTSSPVHCRRGRGICVRHGLVPPADRILLRPAVPGGWGACGMEKGCKGCRSRQRRASKFGAGVLGGELELELERCESGVGVWEPRRGGCLDGGAQEEPKGFIGLQLLGFAPPPQGQSSTSPGPVRASDCPVAESHLGFRQAGHTRGRGGLRYAICHLLVWMAGWGVWMGWMGWMGWEVHGQGCGRDGRT